MVRHLLILTTLLTPLSHAQILEKGEKVVTDTARTIDKKIIHGGFPGVDVPWSCSVGRDEKGYLPKSQSVRITMNRAGDIGFKPDLFKTNLNIGNLFKKILGKNKADKSVDYTTCAEDFLKKVQTAFSDYRSSDCANSQASNPVCRRTDDQIVSKVQSKLRKSDYALMRPDEEIEFHGKVPEPTENESLKNAAKIVNQMNDVVSTDPKLDCGPADPEPMPRLKCDPLPGKKPARSLEELKPILAANNIILATDISDTKYIEEFLAQFYSFPENLRSRMIAKGIKVELIEGDSVKDNPRRSNSFVGTDKLARSGRVTTDLPGLGGTRFIPTQIVVNHLYHKHGSNNLFLHEHGHTMDSTLMGKKISRYNQDWKNLSSTPRYREFLKMLCEDDYCLDFSDEAFAESFAYYNGCDETRKQMERNVPEIAKFFRDLNNSK